MTLSSGSELIGRLAAGVRPAAEGESRSAAGASSFDALLNQAERGGLESGIPITFARGVEVELSQEDLNKLSQLVDRAQSQGASKAVVLTDQGMLQLDVLRRRVEGVVDPNTAGTDVLVGVDAVIRLNQPPDSVGGNVPLHKPGGELTLAGHRSLLDVLDQSARERRSAG